ncbi:HAD family hydrolase [Methanoculleus sp. FWC-SCC3]|uniref:HAD family hydrolase n=1 Tax=Methanoculleus methanifontis TaxID=2584086 RepID=A0ABT8M3N0_9EURY|nr:HAD family hydrolase [Methanoculleus sp. FWC-SCC3]MDN7012588.1 HAD family hydrolase [Methanoculleus sp. FWC-SCC3]
MSRRDPSIAGVLFDCYGTLIDVLTDEHDIETYRCLSRWLIYQGVRIAPGDLRDLYTCRVREGLEQTGEPHPEVRVEEVFAGICAEHAVWEIDTARLGAESARAFRAASLRRLGVIRKSKKLLDLFSATKTGVVSNGQRVFSEQEMRMLGLYGRLGFVIFSSDLGYQKPDARIYAAALGRMRLPTPEVLFIGDNAENDIDAPRKIGMQALHVEEAWRRYGV